MKTAAKILGITGGAIGLLLALFFFFMLGIEYFIPGSGIGLVPMILCAGYVLASAPGLIGGLLVKKKKTVAGVLMLIGALPSLFFAATFEFLRLAPLPTLINFIVLVLLLPGGIFALIPEKKHDIQREELS